MSFNTVLSFNNKLKPPMEHFYQTIGEDWFTYPNLYSEMVRQANNFSHFVEVGSWKGRSAAFMGVEIINSNKTIKFDCVDTWEGSIEHQELDIVKEKKLYDFFLSNIESVKHVINPIRTTSLEASKNYADNSLDFVFIDASHEYLDVLEDIKAWLPKVKPGGVLAGHDYGSSGVNKAVNEFFVGKQFNVEEDCWIFKKETVVKEDINVKENTVTLVTGLWDIKRGDLGEGWSRSYDQYLSKFEELLKTNINLIIYGDYKLENFVWERRSKHNTQFIRRDIGSFINNEFYNKIQEIRTDESWLNLAGWLRESTQAKLELYNPLVMSKMFLLHDAKILDQFNSDYLFWIDAGITTTVHSGYFTENLFKNIDTYVDKFSFVCFSYDAENEIHGFKYTKLCEYANNKKVNKVARGGFFGGPKSSISEANGIYYQTLQNTLSAGYMGTEESIFTIMLYNNCEVFNYFSIESNGLLYLFFENLSKGELIPKTECTDVSVNFNLNTNNTALYIITYNSPKQVETLIKSMLMYDPDFVYKPQLILLNNSTDRSTDEGYSKLCTEYNILEIKKDNIGICGGRQFIAEHAEESGYDFYFFFEDDMFFYPKEGEVCKNGFNRYVQGLYNTSLYIIKNYGFDFLKLSYTEFFGDNGLQWAWYNLPQNKREEYFPEYNKLPSQGIDLKSPRTMFKNINVYKGVPFASGEVYYSNWPQVVSKQGNRKLFLDTKFENPFEQTWMSYIFQKTREGKISPGLLLLTPTEHDRFDHYPAEQRREN